MGIRFWAGIIGFCGLISGVASGTGAISSGGGRLFKYEGNPWWLENTKEVEYCIDINEQDFGVDYWTSVQTIEWALSEWQKAFRFAPDNFYENGVLEPFGQVRVATQHFVRTTCHDDIELRFQLGTLSSRQKKYFDDPSNYVAAAIRTKYDLENLSSAGFIYLAPQHGLLKPNYKMPKDGWKVGDHFPLKTVLLHELGHLFGVLHGQGKFLMDEAFPQESFRMPEMSSNVGEFKAGAALREMLKLLRPIYFFSGLIDRVWEGEAERSPISLGYSSFFGFGIDQNCKRLSVNGTKLVVSSALTCDGPWNVRGILDNNTRQSEVDPFIVLNLPAEQQVFTKLPLNKDGLFEGVLEGEEYFSKITFEGQYIPSDKSFERFPLSVTFKPQGSTQSVGVKNANFAWGVIRTSLFELADR